MENWDLLQSLKPQHLLEPGALELHLCAMEKGCKDLCPETSQRGTPLERSGMFHSCFLPPCKQHKKRGLSCCHLSSRSGIPSAGSCCSQPPSTQTEG